MVLKPRFSNSIGMLLGGCVLAWFGLRLAVYLGGYLGLIPGVFGILGVLWIALAVIALARRNQLAIIIDEQCIEIPESPINQRQPRKVRIPRSDIKTILKHDSLKGHLVEIVTTSGERILVQARLYCEIDDFIRHCRNCGLPIA